MKKLPHQLNDEDLLNLVEEVQPEVDKPIVYPNDVLQFIATFNIEPGEDNIKQHTIYNIYKVWSQDALSKPDFLKEMKLFFNSTSGTNQAVSFKINQSAIKLTHAAYKYYTNNNIQLHSPKWAKHFQNFLKFHALSPGDYWINGEILYFIYDKFAHATGLDDYPSAYMKKEMFFVYCKIFLKFKQAKHQTLYAISDNIKQFFQIDQLARMEKMYDEEKENKKKRRKTPRSKSEVKSKD